MAADEMLARALASLARGLRRTLQARLREGRAGPVREFYEAAGRAFGVQEEREFADGWAQTSVYLLLAARWVAPGVDPAEHLPRRLARVDARLGELVAQLLRLAEVAALQAAVAEVRLAEVATEDPVLHFYETFLGAYDPRLRAARGVYFTPAPVVRYLVATTDAVLRDRLGLTLGLADARGWGEYAAARGLALPQGVDPACPFVQVVDPAAGTGTFLMEVIRRAHATMTARWTDEGLDAERRGAAWTAYARGSLLPRLRGVERMLAPWAIAALRLSMLLEETGFVGSLAQPVLILADTLSGPDLLPGPISVVLGNPPYEREAPTSGGGGWIRGAGERALLADFVGGDARAGAHAKNLYNLYVYFWRWACWQVFERRPQAPGVVAMVTGASFLRGPGFAGMRAHMRGRASQIHVLDLEGDRRGASLSDNVFAVSVPVAATTIVRDGLSLGTGEVRWRRALGGRADKLELCARTTALEQLAWTTVAADGPWVGGDEVRLDFDGWPRVVDLFPWQHSGAQWKRTWPISGDPEVLARRWQALVASPERAALFHETRDRRVTGRYPPLRSPGLDLAEGTAEPLLAASRPPPMRAYGFRALDRRWCLADARLGDFLRPTLWWVAGPRQVYLTSLLTGALGPGPAAMISAEVPDLHFFCGRGGKDVIPLWRDPGGTQANLGAGAWELLREWYGPRLRAEDVLAYAYALLSAPGYTTRFAAALRAGGPRLPLVRERERWFEVAALGHRQICVHSFGARWLGEGAAPEAAVGAARCVLAPSRQPTRVVHGEGALRLYEGEECVGVFAPVPAAVWEYALSGHRPVPAWVAARLAGRAGRRSSPLDAIRSERWTSTTTAELLRVLWTVEATLALGARLDEALELACAGPCWRADELPPPTRGERREPAVWDR